ncbi:MAG TPA: class I SAM-dependent methyltransferase [Clostridiales bacterium]|nr:class I SAM-dependent methyltransferase [Clostridiales bacterium]
MEHYYSSDPTAPHDINIIHYNIKGRTLKLKTDAGVFSKNKVDFGTDLLIKSLPSLHGKVLDLGCGYGPIGICVAYLNPKTSVDMVDINKRAIELAKSNIVDNDIPNARAFVSDGFSNVDNAYDAIITNPPIRAGKKVVYGLFEQSKYYLNPNGALYVVIQKKQGAPSAIKKLKSIFGNCNIINKQKGYFILQSTLI